MGTSHNQFSQSDKTNKMSKKQVVVVIVSSNVVEGRVLGLEVRVWCGRLLSLASSLADQGSKPVGIPDGSWLLDRT